MSDIWADTWAARFNKFHAPAGSATGGQFAAGSGSGSGKGSHPTPTNQHPVGTGETGKRVSDLQARLNAGGFKPPLKVDGIFGPKTLAAVRSFQKAHGLKVDGLVGPLTTAALRGKPAKPAAAHHTPAHTTTHTKAHPPAKPAPKPAPKTVKRGSDLEYGHGSKLWDYWTRGEGFAKWSGAVHKWTTLRDLLLAAGVPSVSVDGLTTNIIMAVMPGYMKLAHAKAGRSAVTEPDGSWDADGLDGSWDGDHTDLPDLTGLTVADLEAADGAPPDTAAQRAMPKLGTGARFARLKSSLAAKGAHDPGALAAYIGRKKFGRAKFTKLAAKARGKGGASRMAPLEYFRTYELEDIHVVRAAQGDSTGRLVEAYATAFDSPAEIHDHQGSYIEEIDPSAFNKVLADISRSRAGFGKVKVMFNHGLTIMGTPSERGSMPIGRAMEIRPETRGLLTLVRYSETPFADEVLENIRNGAITAQSFTGRIVRSDPELRHRGDQYRPRNGQLPRVRRTELGLKEFGPTPFEAYSGAEIVGVRMSTPGTWEPDENDQQDEALPPDGEAAAGEPLTRTGSDGDEDDHSARYHQHALYVLRAKEAREKAGLVW